MIQTDWSGGPEVLGPVTDWQNQFYMSLDVEYNINPGKICLVSTCVENVISSKFEDPRSTCAVDLDGDQDMDVIAVSFTDDSVSCWLNLDGSGTSWQEVFLGEVLEPLSVTTSDFDGDGDMDAATLSSWDGIDVWLNMNGQGTSWSRISVVPNYNEGCVEASDVDGDGDIDLLVCSSASGVGFLTLFENIDGSGLTWYEHVLNDSCGGIRSICVADVDGDGDDDVFGARWTPGYVSWWENPGSTEPGWQEYFIDENFGKASEVCSCDMDGDGDVDVVGTSMQESEVRWWENADGFGGEWLPHEIGSQFGAFTVCASDIDNDGDFDVIVGGRGNNSVCLYTNISGPGLVWSSRVIDPDDADPYCVRAADLNGDDLADVLVGETDFFTELTWWNLNSYPQTGYVTSSILCMEEEPQWLAVDWSGEEPPGTETVFQFRTGTDPQNLGYWTGYIYEPCDLCDIVSSGDTLFQYRVRFFTEDSLITPSLDNFLVSWDPNGLSEEESINTLNAISPNPVAGGSVFSVSFSLAGEAEVELIIFNLMGRSVDSYASVFPAGETAVEFPAPSSGIYIVRMNSESFHCSRRLVVL
ncbi:MAG: T9SS type A sorting domain-containing protein [Candidatus Fermentibacteraceae bacterium]|nr:T9SS type A sorting domain-containing protein [Candidatus Fermentibacteraceae bacterium]